MKEKIKNFAMNNWDNIICVGAVVGAEIAVCLMYKKYLEKL